MKLSRESLGIAFAFVLGLGIFACNTGPHEKASAEPAPTIAKPAVTSQKLGQPTPKEATEVSLSAVARTPKEYLGKTIVTSGTVGSVCQHMGCWMTLSDESGEAFIRMAGHAFMVPKDSKGKKARVYAKLVDSSEPEAKPVANCSGDGKDHCKAEAEKQNGKPLAKLELEALGVELF